MWIQPILTSNKIIEKENKCPRRCSTFMSIMYHDFHDSRCNTVDLQKIPFKQRTLITFFHW